MKKISIVLAVMFFWNVKLCLRAQGFVNLDFESANVAGYPPGSIYPTIPVTNTFPGWTTYDALVGYDFVSLGAASISVNDTNRGLGFVPFQGNFSAALNGIIPSNPPPNDYFAAIGQTGKLPSDVQSLIMWASSVSVFQVAFGGQSIPLFQIGSGANYIIAAGDISAYAGQTGELLFTAPPGHIGFLDNIQFSTSPIPEPTAFSLFVLGGLLLGFRRRNHSR